MITQARIDAEIAPAGLGWITALRAPAIRQLAEAGTLQMSLFDERDMAAITSPDIRASGSSSAAILISPGSSARSGR